MQFFAFYKTSYYLHTQFSMPQEDKVEIKMTEKNITFPEKRKMMTAIKKNRCRGILETPRNQMVNK